MTVNAEKSEIFKNTMEGLKHFLFALSVVGSGLWVYFTFGVTLQIENANAKLLLLENELKRFPIMDVELNLKEINALENDFRLIKVSVTIRNVGTAKSSITLGNDAFSLGVAENEDIKITKFSNVTYSSPYVIPSISSKFDLAIIDKLYMLPNQVHHINTVFKVNKSGLYQIGFKGNPGDSIVQEVDGLDSTIYKYLIRKTEFIYINLNNNEIEKTLPNKKSE
jgi:hypothetical protein